MPGAGAAALAIQPFNTVFIAKALGAVGAQPDEDALAGHGRVSAGRSLRRKTRRPALLIKSLATRHDGGDAAGASRPIRTAFTARDGLEDAALDEMHTGVVLLAERGRRARLAVIDSAKAARPPDHGDNTAPTPPTKPHLARVA